MNTEEFEVNPTFLNKSINLTEGTSENIGSYFGIVNNLGSPGPINLRIHDLNLSNQVIFIKQLAIENNKEVFISSLTKAGSETFINTTLIDSIPLSDVDVWISTDINGTNVIANSKTDALGKVTFFLDPGNYYLWEQKTGHNFNNPTSITVVTV